MGKFYLGLTLALVLVVCGLYYLYRTTGYSFGLANSIFVKGTINISNQEVFNGGAIPKKYTCDGDNISPQLLLDRVQGDAKSLVLIIDDPTARPATFTHYIVFNIDPSTTTIDEGKIPDSATIATNDYGKTEYSGPCPISGTHKYYFRIFALDSTLSITESAKRGDIDRAMQGHVIGKGDFFGEYSK